MLMNFRAVQSALQVLVINIMNNVKPAFIKMTKMPWATYEHVGDASPYAAEIEKKINTLFPSLVDMVPKSYYITLCDKTVMYVHNDYLIINNITEHFSLLIHHISKNAKRFPMLEHNNSYWIPLNSLMFSNGW